jgi:hypothetical protein
MCWVAYLIAATIARRQRVKTSMDFHSKLLDRLGSGHDFAQFLASEGGARLVETLSLEAGDDPKRRLLRSLQWGTVLTVLGFGLSLTVSEIKDPDLGQPIAFLAGLTASVGVGLLLATAFTHRLARRLKLLNGDHAGAPGSTSRPSA